MSLALRKFIAVAASAMAMTVGAVALSPSAAYASATGCSPPTYAQVTQYQSCISDSGNSTGTYVGTMKAWGLTDVAGYYHMEIINPQGKKLANGTQFYYHVTPGDGGLEISDAVWKSNNDVEQGQYCAIVWYYHDSTYSNVGKACIGVS